MKVRTLVLAWFALVAALLAAAGAFTMVVINGATGDFAGLGIFLLVLVGDLYMAARMAGLIDAYQKNAARMREIEDQLRGKE